MSPKNDFFIMAMVLTAVVIVGVAFAAPPRRDRSYLPDEMKQDNNVASDNHEEEASDDNNAVETDLRPQDQDQNYVDGEKRTNDDVEVGRPSSTHEDKSPSYHQDVDGGKKNRIGSLLDRIMDIPIGVLESVNQFLNYKQTYKASTENKAVELTKTAPSKMLDYIFNIPITILKTVQNVFKWFAR